MKSFKRIVSAGLVLFLCLSCALPIKAKVTWPPAPAISSDAGILMNADTGTVLYSKNINNKMYPASITKLMTVLLVLENCKMDQKVTFSRDAVYNIEFGSNHIGMTVGEEITVEECLYGILLESANEVCNAVGELIAGDQDSFAALMTKRAKELGCQNTNFVNANGLHNKEHYTSAYDMALICKECLKHEDFRRIAGTKSYQLQPTNNTEEIRYLNNSHKMFPGRTYEYDGFECGKTGFTDQALNTLVTVARKGDVELICVTLHGNQTHYKDTATLFDYGFGNYKNVLISEADSNLQTDFYINKESVLSEFVGDSKDYTFSPDKTAKLIIPNTGSLADMTQKLTNVNVDGNTLTATLDYYYGEDFMGTLPITLTKPETVESAVSGFAESHPLLFTIIRIVLIIFAVLIVGYIALYIYAKHRNRKRRRERRNRDKY